jgi:hypothetical protein
LEVQGEVTLNSSLDVKHNLTVNSALNGGIVLDSSDLHVSTNYDGYVEPKYINDSTNEFKLNYSTVYDSSQLAFQSTTLQNLTTQKYVDKQVWEVRSKLNLLFSSIDGGSNLLDNLNNLKNDISDISDIINNLENKQKSLCSQNIACLPSVWGNTYMPLPIPKNIPSPFIGDGWYFKNYSSSSIKWNIPVSSGMKWSDIQNFYINIYNVNTLTNLPLITIQTNMNTYNYVSNNQGENDSYYCLYVGTNAPSQYLYNYTNILKLQPVTNDPTTNEIITSLSITTTNDNSLNYEFILSSFNIIQSSGIISFTYKNSDATTNYLFNYFFRRFENFSYLDDANSIYLSNYSNNVIN